MNKSLKADFILLLVTIFWGAGFPLTKIALKTITPLYHIGLRFLIAGVLLSLIFIKRLKNIDKKVIKASLVLSFLLFSCYAFQTIGLQFTTASKSGFYSGLAVLFVPIFLYFYSKHKIKLNSIISTITATIGLFLLCYSGNDFSFNLGDFLTVLCSVTYAWQLILTGTYVRELDTTLLSIIQMFFVALFGMSSALIFEPFPTSISIVGFWSLMFSAVLCTAFAFWTQTTMQKYTSANHVAVVFAMEPVFGALTSYFMLGEQLGIRGFIGGFLIVASMIFTEIDIPMKFRSETK